MITPTTHGDDYAETAWQRKLRNQANRKKKRGRGLQQLQQQQSKMQICEYFFENACYSVTKYYLCKQNNKRSLLGRKQRSQVVRSFLNRYQFSCISKVTSLFSIRYTLINILRGNLRQVAVYDGWSCAPRTLKSATTSHFCVFYFLFGSVLRC